MLFGVKTQLMGALAVSLFAALCYGWFQHQRIESLRLENRQLETAIRAIREARDIENEARNLDDDALADCLSGGQC